MNYCKAYNIKLCACCEDKLRVNNDFNLKCFVAEWIEELTLNPYSYQYNTVEDLCKSGCIEYHLDNIWFETGLMIHNKKLYYEFTKMKILV